ncbi:MAG TPA: hypothetical protein VEM15_16580 [Thermodesulfobacteriota bacterium]|nr:hypothetical protein [Thermodesulfobacteriota bacterium]
MKNITFTLNTGLSANDAMIRISNFLTSEHVDFQADLNSVKAEGIPIPLFSFDKRLYTKRNWVGINPFIFVSGVNFLIKESHSKQIQIDVNIRQGRAIFMYVFFVLFFLCIMAAAVLDSYLYPNILILLLIIAVTLPILVHLFIFELCIKRLIKSEIKGVIN